MDLRLALMAGTDLPVPECTLVLHQPRIREIAMMGEIPFFQAVQCLTINKSMLENMIPGQEVSNFMIFMMVMSSQETASQKEDVKTLLSLILPDYKISIMPRSIILINGDQTITIDENNFDPLQEVFKQMFCFKNSDSSNFNPADDRAKEIAKKLQRGRQRIAAQNQQGNTSIFVQYLSVLTVGLGSMSLEDCLDLTMYQMLDLIERYGMFMNWDLDIKARLAGAKGDGQPDNWMKPIH